MKGKRNSRDERRTSCGVEKVRVICSAKNRGGERKTRKTYIMNE